MNTSEMRAYLHEPNARICDECGGLTKTNDGGYRTLIRGTGYTLHFCSAACCSANLNTPGLPDKFRKLVIYTVAATAIDLALCTYFLLR